MKIMENLPRRHVMAGLVAGAALAVVAGATASARVTAPLVCNKGPSGQGFNVGVTMPSSVEAGATYTVRIDGSGSGKISHFGLNYLHDMTVEYLLPAGLSFVEGSGRFVEGTGTPNVLKSPRLSHHGGVVTMRLPDRVDNGTEYTPPSITFQVRAVGAPGSAAVLSFNHFQLKANAFLVGDVAVSCDPVPQPYPIGTTLIASSGSSAPVR